MNTGFNFFQKLYCQEKRLQLMKKKQEMTARKKKLQFEVEFLEYLDKVYEKAEESQNTSDASLSKEQRVLCLS